MIVFIEGVDGVGKTTLINMIKNEGNIYVFRYPNYDFQRYLNNDKKYIKQMKKINKEFSWFLYTFNRKLTKIGCNPIIFVDRSPITSIVYRNKNDIGFLLYGLAQEAMWAYYKPNIDLVTNITDFDDYLKKVKELGVDNPNVKAYLHYRYLKTFEKYKLVYKIMNYNEEEFLTKIGNLAITGSVH